MKFTTYGFDVLCLVGELRFKHHMTRREIADELNNRGVKTTDRNAQMLYERYLALPGASIDQHVSAVLTRTNNDHERFFRQIKTRHRRMRGRRSWNGYILRNGEYVVLVDDALRQNDLFNRLSLVSYEEYKKQRHRWNNRLNESILRKRFRRNPQTYLQELENKHSVLVIPL